jgi:uncharacterized membrane protein YfcA
VKGNRSTLIGAGIGLFLGMPLFEAALLVMLAVDGEWFNAAYTIHYFTESANVILLLVVFHAVTTAIGALVGALMHQAKQRRKLRVVAGGRQA